MPPHAPTISHYTIVRLQGCFLSVQNAGRRHFLQSTVCQPTTGEFYAKRPAASYANLCKLKRCNDPCRNTPLAFWPPPSIVILGYWSMMRQLMDDGTRATNRDINMPTFAASLQPSKVATTVRKSAIWRGNTNF